MNTDLIKAVATVIVSGGVGAVVTNAIKATTPEDMKIYTKVAVTIGTVVVARAIGDVTTTYTMKQIDELAGGFETVKKIVKKTTEKEA